MFDVNVSRHIPYTYALIIIKDRREFETGETRVQCEHRNSRIVNFPGNGKQGRIRYDRMSCVRIVKMFEQTVLGNTRYLSEKREFEWC